MNTAALVFRAGRVRCGAKVKVTNSGLFAIGGLVSGILLSTAAVVWAATSVARQRPIASSLLRRRQR
ncbi:hypothetical protein EGY25_03050 [Brevundimonas intermedia]|uniref:Uncharacterized protein n=1 Tax=Brevundimonas intermedia TaxID=74315 RepID=A0A4Y9S2M2_9CAUL|nr:hypothetical protein [Brevundimonas intermedia]TFW14199.1 hypothetical protein EGY25_03050 [Brevundimonas intermedia]